MPSYKLMYFNTRGRAETARMLFALADKEFEDYRFKDGEWPGELKSKKEWFPLGQAPVLLIDGKPLPQCKAINRHLAREFKLYGANNEEAMQIDVICETVDDILTKLIPIFYEKDEAKRKALVETFKEGTNQFIQFLNDIIGASPEKKFSVGNTETLGDVILFWMCDVMFPLVPSTSTDYKELDKFYKCIKENSKLTEYLKNRPADKTI